MSNKHLTLLLAAPILAIGCSRMPDSEGSPQSRPISVEITARTDIGIESRTALGDDGISVRWSTGDRIALWALDTEGSALFEAQPFELRHYNATYDEARFTGTVNSMAEGRYTYCAVSPQPATHDGTRVTYEIPAEQNGAFDGSLDIMAAEPVADAPALVEGLNGNLSLRFRHQIHLLRITIPAGGNNLQEPISTLELEFPQPVVGRLSFDAATPDATPELTDGNSKLTIRLANPVPADQELSVYAAIAPVEISADDAIRIKAIGTGGGESQTSSMPGKAFTAGHTTPIRYYVPERYRITRIFFSLAGRDGRTDLPEDLAGGYGCSTLGEPVTSFTLTGPEGVDLGDGSNTRTFQVNPENLYKISYEGEFTDNLSGKPFTVTFESAHTAGLPYYESAEAKTAAEPYSFRMPQLTADSRNTVKAFAVPYLLYETFDSITTFSDNEGTTGISTPDAIWIPGAAGWSAARVGGEAGKCVRIVGHREGGFFVPADYMARMDSEPLAAIRDGMDVTVVVSFNYSGSTNKGAPKFKYGLSTVSGLVNGGNENIETQVGTVTANTEGSYDLVNQSIAPFRAIATNATRLSWVAYGEDSIPFSLSYYFYYIYIDDIKVSIANQ